ncbi:MAG: T9SS type A sorting domain-containing protein [Bacteroidota bacterium]|nr:T9SS type A sorting domain-containing protein [Bacteroidota bacterium]
MTKIAYICKSKWIIIFTCFSFYSNAQYINNGSLEGGFFAWNYTPIPFWSVCAQTPDYQPASWCLNLLPNNGIQYIGFFKGAYLNGSETIGQNLSKALNKDSMYFVSLFAAQSQSFCASPPNTSFPGFIYVTMGTSNCSRKNFVYKSRDVVNYDIWNQSCGIFKPDSNYNSIAFTPWGYDSILNNSYTKYLLIDNIDLGKIEDRLSYTLSGPNTACVGQTVALTLTGLPTCLGVGFSCPSLTLSPTLALPPEASSGHASTARLLTILCSIPGVHTISGYAQTGTVTSWPVYHVVTVTACAIPQIATIIGPNVVCAGATATYSVSTQIGVNYKWYVSTGTGTPLSEGEGAGVRLLSTFGEGPGVRLLTITAFNFNGTISGTKNITIIDCSPPVQPTIVGPNTVCSGTSSTYSVITQIGVNYKWYVSTGTGTPLSVGEGAGVRLFSPSGGGQGEAIITVTASNLYGTVTGIKSITIVSCLPPNPCTINKCYPSYNFFQKGDTVTIASYSGCDPGLSITGIRWLVINKYSNEPEASFIFKDTAKVTSGEVIISITGSNGCVYSKNLLQFTIDRTKPTNTCIGANCVIQSLSKENQKSEIVNRQSSIKVYPNPTKSELTIETETTGSFILYSMYGNEAMRWEITTKKEVVNISDLPKGIYFYRFDVWKGKLVKE